jgi:hypothetical protein
MITPTARAAIAVLVAGTAAQGRTSSLEVRTPAGWTAWAAFAPGDSVRRRDALDAAIAWRELQPGLRVGDFEVRVAGGRLHNSVAVVELDPSRFHLALAADSPWARSSAEDWLRRDSSIVLAVNTGLFRDNGTPQGLVLLRGTRRSALAGWLDAVVVLENGAPRLTDVAGALSLDPAASAFQTLPWLVRSGRVAFGATSGRRLSRTHRDRRISLCLGDDGLVRIALSNFEVFGANAGRIPVGLTIPEQAAIAAGLGCRDAVALDGGISAQLAVRGSSRIIRMPGWRRVPLMMVARRR